MSSDTIDMKATFEFIHHSVKAEIVEAVRAHPDHADTLLVYLKRAIKTWQQDTVAAPVPVRTSQLSLPRLLLPSQSSAKQSSVTKRDGPLADGNLSVPPLPTQAPDQQALANAGPAPKGSKKTRRRDRKRLAAQTKRLELSRRPSMKPANRALVAKEVSSRPGSAVASSAQQAMTHDQKSCPTSVLARPVSDPWSLAWSKYPNPWSASSVQLRSDRERSQTTLGESQFTSLLQNSVPISQFRQWMVSAAQVNHDTVSGNLHRSRAPSDESMEVTFTGCDSLPGSGASNSCQRLPLSYLRASDRCGMEQSILKNLNRIFTEADNHIPSLEKDAQSLVKTISIFGRLLGDYGSDTLHDFLHELRGHKREHMTCEASWPPTDGDHSHLADRAVQAFAHFNADKVSVRMSKYMEKIHLVEFCGYVDLLEREFNSPNAAIRYTLKELGFREWNSNISSPIVDFVLWRLTNIHPSTANSNEETKQKHLLLEKLRLGRLLIPIANMFGLGTFVMMPDSLFAELAQQRAVDVDAVTAALAAGDAFAKDYPREIEEKIMKPLVVDGVDGMDIKFH